MSNRLQPRGRLGPAAGLCLALASTVTLAVLSIVPNASAGSLSGTLYREQGTDVLEWLAANPSDPRASVISTKIGSQPAAKWIAVYSPSTVQSEVSAYVSAANSAGQVPVVVPYMIPNRDCNGWSAGGAPNISAYNTWMSNFAKGLGTKLVIVILEPDSLALQTCLSAAQVTERNNALKQAVTTIKANNPSAKVYLDAGHSSWNSAADAAGRLTAAGVANSAGFYTNASNYRYTTDEINFGKNVLAALGNPSSLHQVIDTSRNGNGPLGSEWCDPAGRLIGNPPSLSTGQATVDAFVWIKPPGEADGCAGTAGVFLPELAYALAGGGTMTTTTTRTTTTRTTTTRATTTTRTTTTRTTTTRATTTTRTTSTTAGAKPCAVSYRQTNAWPGNFQAEITVKNTSAADVNGWTLGFSFPNDQRITSTWNALTTQSGTAVTMKNESYNALLPKNGGSATVTFQATVGASNSAPTAYTLNGSACSVG